MERITFILLFLLAAIWNGTTGFAQTNWEKYPGNPVLDVGHEPWDSTWVFYPEVFFDGIIYRMWYTGFDGSTSGIGYATSTDGITWTKFNNPVLSGGLPGSWDEAVIDASVTYDGNTYHMWYRGQDDNLTPVTTRIGYATSLDGVIWVKYDNPSTVDPPYAESDPVINPGDPGSWDGVWIMHPTVIFDGTIYHMWYMGWDGNIPRIGYATSPDGINWTKYDDPSTVNPPYADSDPVMNPGDPGSWDAAAVESPCVIHDGTIYYMWYMGGDSLSAGTPFPAPAKVGYATSTDGITWMKFTNPVLEAGAQGTWDGIGVGDPDVIYDGITYCMYYDGSGFDGVFRFRIGFATDSSMVGIGDNVSNELPRKFDLHKNYPNPFNPSTTIKFSLPTAAEVSLVIYNVAGQEVERLIERRSMAPGQYSAEWAPRSLPSGIYFYRLTAGGFAQSRKMVLLK